MPSRRYNGKYSLNLLVNDVGQQPRSGHPLSIAISGLNAILSEVAAIALATPVAILLAHMMDAFEVAG
jgi:hypothetical protein